MLEIQGGLLYEKAGDVRGLTQGVDDEKSPFLSVKVSFGVHLKK